MIRIARRFGAMSSFDMVVIGAGPGGYVCAIRGAQLGLKVGLVEKEPRLGGTCLRVGCIPSKALLESSELYYEASNHFDVHGIGINGGVELKLNTMLERKTKIVHELTDGLQLLMKKNKITVLQGTGSFLGPQKILVTDAEGGTQEVEAKNIVVATGSAPIELPFAKFDGEYIVSSTEALSFPEVPKKMIVIGAGAVGLELGSVWSRLGAEVTVVELLPRVTPFADKQVSTALQRALTKQGLNILLETKMLDANVKDGQVHITVEDKNGEKSEISADKLLVSVGRRPYTGGLDAEKIGLKLERGKVVIDDQFRSNVPSVYAIGDVVEGPMLAHKAEDEGAIVAEIISGQVGHINHDLIPNVVYTNPELAMVGKTEQQLKEAGVKYKSGKFMFRPNGRAKALNAADGFIKIVADKETDKVLGVHIVGPRASELIAEAVVLMEFGASTEDIVRTCHAHPTLSEVMREAAMAVDKRAIHG